MSIHKQVWFEMKPVAVTEVKALIQGYVAYVARFAARQGDEWRWRTYQDAGRPTRFCSLMWHRNDRAEARARDADGTKAFADGLYKHVVDGHELRFELGADSHP